MHRKSQTKRGRQPKQEQSQEKSPYKQDMVDEKALNAQRVYQKLKKQEMSIQQEALREIEEYKQLVGFEADDDIERYNIVYDHQSSRYRDE